MTEQGRIFTFTGKHLSVRVVGLDDKGEKAAHDLFEHMDYAAEAGTPSIAIASTWTLLSRIEECYTNVAHALGSSDLAARFMQSAIDSVLMTINRRCRQEQQHP